MKAINLVPVAERREGIRLTNLSPGTLTLIGVLCAALVAVVAVVMVGNTTKQRQSDLAELQAQTARAQAQISQLAPNAAELSALQQSDAAVRSLLGQRYDWPTLFSRVSSSLPAGVKLTNMNGTLGAAATPTPATGAGSLQLSGCAESLRTLASAIQRMRVVRGVGDVTLTSSARDGGGAAGGCPHPRSFQLTVGLTAPTTSTAGGTS